MIAPRDPRYIVGSVATLAVAAAGGAFLMPTEHVAGSFDVTLVAAAFAGAFILAQRMGFVLHWRGHTTKVSIEEFALVGGLLLLPPVALVSIVGAAALLAQVVMRRPPSKAVYNVSQYVLGASLAVLAFHGLVALGVPPVWASAAGPVVFALVSQASIAVLFARLESESAARVFRQRFLHWSMVTSGIGVSVGLAAYALWMMHPFASFAIVPVLMLLFRLGRLTEWAEEEVRVHEMLSAAARTAAAQQDFAGGAESILKACGDALGAGEARVRVAHDGASAEWAWRHPQGAASQGLRVPVEVQGRMVGELIVWPRPGQRLYGDRDRHLLAIAATALGSAAATHGALDELRDANRRLVTANRELEEFTLWTTHDMREPLRSVAQLASILHDDLPQLTIGEAREVAGKIQHASDTLKDRIKALHEFSRIVQEDGAFEPVDLTALVEEARENLAARIDERSVQVEVRAGLPLVRAQPARLAKVFGNLLENAIKHNDKATPVVTVACFDRGSEWELSVHDNGPGVDASFRDRAFQLFQRGPRAKEAGSGAGLAIVKRIIEQHGGKVWIEPMSGGADFRFTLPKA